MQNPSRGAPVASFATPVSKSKRTDFESRRPCPPPQVLKPEFNGYPLIADLHRSSAGSLSLPALSKCGSSCPPLAGAVSLCDCEAPPERLCDTRLEQCDAICFGLMPFGHFMCFRQRSAPASGLWKQRRRIRARRRTCHTSVGCPRPFASDMARSIWRGFGHVPRLPSIPNR
jgi:hypothetical protein